MNFEDVVNPVNSGHFPALGFDPAPGTIPRINQVATTLGTIAGSLGNTYQDLARLNTTTGFWEGEAAAAFHHVLGDIPSYLDKAQQSFSHAATTLTTWADDLVSLQRHAVDLEHLAATAQGNVNQASANPNLHPRIQICVDPVEFQQQQQAINQASATLQQAQNQLAAIRESAARLRAQHQELTAKVAAALRAAKDEAPELPGLLDKIGGMFGDFLNGLKKLAKDVGNWVKDHADAIAKIGDVLSAVGGVLSLLALATSWIPGVNAVVAAAAIGVNGAAALTHLVAKAGGADVSWGKVGLDALGMLPMGNTLAGAKTAIGQAARTAGTAKIVSIFPKLGKVGSELKSAGFYAKTTRDADDIVKVTGHITEPVTVQVLKETPKAAIEQAARHSQVKFVSLLNSLPGVHLDPFSTAGLIASTTAKSGIQVGAGIANEVVVGHTHGYIANKVI